MEIHIDKITENDIEKLLPGDVVYIKSIDSLGDKYEDMAVRWETITKEKGAHIVVSEEPTLDTRKYKNGSDMSKVVLAVLRSVSENEKQKHEAVLRRNKEAIEIAKKNGVQFGIPEHPLPENFKNIVAMWRTGELTIREAAKKCDMPKSTFYDKARKYG